MQMKAITLHQPWASLIVHGYKTYETRSWITSYRGWIAIHAAKRKPAKSEMMPWDIFKRRLEMCGCFLPAINEFNMPLGAIVGMVYLDMTFKVEHVINSIGADDIAFGDWAPGRYAWRMSSPALFKVPVLACGRQGLWKWLVPSSREVQVRDIMQRRIQ